MTAGSGRSVPMKRNYKTYTGGGRPGIAEPARDANGSAEEVANEVADVIDNSTANGTSGVTNGVEGLANGAGAGSSQDAIHVVYRTGAESPRMDPFPSPVKPPVRIEDAVVASNGSSGDSAATVSLPGLAAVAAFNRWEETIMTSDSIRNIGETISPPPRLTAPGVTSNGRSNDSAPIHPFNRSAAPPTASNHNRINESTATSSRNRTAAVTANPRAIYQQVANNLRMVTHAQMDEPVEGVEGVQFDEYVKILKEQKTNNLALYKATNNHRILQPYWTARGKEFNRAFIWGDWVFGAKLNNLERSPRLRPAELHRTFIDIEIKRIAGNDQETLEACGVHPHFAFLGLVGYKLTSASGLADEANSGGDPTTNSRSSTSSGSASTVSAMTSSGPGAWPTKCAPTTTEAVPSSNPAATETETVTAISSPGAWPAESADDPSPAVSPSSTVFSITSSTTFDGRTNPVTPIVTAPQREANAAARTRLYGLIDACPSFEDLRANSAIYLVRVTAIPNPPMWSSTQTNPLNGPYSRKATLCGLGGWVVPHASKSHSNRSEHASGLPAAPIGKDWTFAAPSPVEGDYVPIWEGAEEPKLEDVYHMVWDLVAGRDFVGLVPGHGFGRRREGAGFSFEKLRGENPFQSPSRE